MAQGTSDDIRGEVKREDITLAFQTLCLKIVSFTLVPIFFFRSALAYSSDQKQVAGILFVLAILAFIVPFVARWTHDYKHLSFFSCIFFLSMEAFLIVKQGEHYTLFLFLIPFVVIYCSFLSGMIYGTLSGLILLLEAGIMIYLSERSPSGENVFRIAWNDIFAHLLVAEVLVVLVLFTFQHVLRKGESEIKARRIQRAKTARRAALAEVLGKLAHEVNNPLAILNSSFLLFRKAQDEGRGSGLSRKQLLGFMQEGNSRIQNVLDNLRIFAEGDLLEPMQVIDVEELLVRLRQTFYERIRSSGVQIEIVPGAAQQVVFGRPKQIFFILSMLLDNAVDAMVDEPGIVTVRFVPNEKSQRFEVEDNGIGISDEIAERIFQPFVSTKNLGRSMGMNLSICRGIASEHGGQLGFIRKGKGTIFWLQLPKNSSA